MSDPTFITHVLDLLGPLGPARARPMMGGHMIFCWDLPIGLITDDRLFLKVSGATREAFARAGCEPFTYERRGRAVEMSFWSAPDEALDAPEAMRPWAERALEAAAEAKKPRRKAAPKRRRRASTRGGR